MLSSARRRIKRRMREPPAAGAWLLFSISRTQGERERAIRSALSMARRPKVPSGVCAGSLVCLSACSAIGGYTFVIWK